MEEESQKPKAMCFQPDESSHKALEQISQDYQVSKTKVIRDSIRFLYDVVKMTRKGYRLQYQHSEDPSRVIEVWAPDYMLPFKLRRDKDKTSE